MVTCKGCILVKIQLPSLSSLNTMPYKQNVYDYVLRYKHWECDCEVTEMECFRGLLYFVFVATRKPPNPSSRSPPPPASSGRGAVSCSGPAELPRRICQ